MRSHLYLHSVPHKRMSSTVPPPRPTLGSENLIFMADFKWDAHGGLFLRNLAGPGLPKQYTGADTSRVRA